MFGGLKNKTRKDGNKHENQTEPGFGLLKALARRGQILRRQEKVEKRR